ncbi:non-ribosomal peptide synthetase [Kutzneria sp. 744]|uniref:non-ribosomal peptide synthetase n=1 Tax=Kutzneria sp. (strain 744) TaxID=345341 RepID=UPI0003EEB388|nr:non-ribosomal peptide synthetase [Kutzneria sp. 744]EWM19075.1 non-ribosomal peptide synthetase [Kutzneria sp. 744]
MTELALTAAQHGIWTGQQLDPRSPAYNTAEYIEIHGPVDVDLLMAAIQRAVADAEALSARFIDTDDGPRQILEPRPWSVHVADVTEQAALDWMASDVAKLVDLADDPLFAHAVFRVAEDRFLWYHRVHHILLDGYGLALVARRVAEVYTALAEGRQPAEHEFGTLASVVDEDVTYREGPLHQRDGDFWVDYQQTRPAPATLAGRTAPLARNVVRAVADIDRPTSDLLRDVAKSARANWTEVLCAAIATYLRRMTGAAEISLALPVMLRTGSVALRVPCMVLNVVQVWTDFTENPSLVAVTTQVATHLRRSRRHHRYRYEQLRRDLRLVGSQRKLFGPSANIMPFDYGLRFASNPSVVRNVSAGLVEDLAFNVYDRADGQGLRIALDGNPNLYSPANLAAHVRRFGVVLRRLLELPEKPVGEVDLLLDDERDLLLHKWNDTERAWPAGTVVDLLDARVATTPDATALVACDGTFSYRELDDRVRRLAGVLAARGAGPGDVVMLLLPRTADAIIALFAVLRTGAAYLPADPDYPARRIEYLISDAHPRLVVTTTALGGDLTAPTVLLDDLDEKATVAELPVIDPDQPLCLIYTSGSTGQPKGAVITHRAMVNLFHHHRTEMIASERTKAALTASLSFDTSWEGLLWLLAGHELHFVDDDVRRDPADLLDYVHEHRIDFLDVTPTYATELLAAGLLEPGRHRPAVLALGGEAAGPGLWTALRTAPDIDSFNLYGPTECTVDTTWARLADSPTPVIGRPIGNARCYVLDEGQRLLPPGAAGELCLAGVPVSAGYHNRPELTAERFAHTEFGRLYRTGDLARWRADGQLEYLGRVDEQLKVRGFRIEPGEIEAALLTHPAVGQAAVLAQADRLVAYVVPGKDEPDPAALRRHLAERLPDYMVPPVYVTLDRLPTTTSGKLDRAALPAPTIAATAGRTPSTERERSLCALFADTLGLPEVGVDDDFFALGGHSLLVARLLRGIRDQFGTRLGIRDVFDAPTVAHLVQRMDTDTPVRHPWEGIDLAAEVRLDPEIVPTGAPRTGPPRSVLLTGATGFLGAFLLRELLDRTDARVHCLVRADDTAAAEERLRASLRRYGLSEKDLDRVVPVPGDLAEPGLGLSAEDFRRLTEVDVVLHNGAWVNHLEPYARLRAANVTGTEEVLRLAAIGGAVVHFVSTCDTVVAVDGNPPVLDESRRVAPESLLANGYIASKWVSEGLVLAAAERGLPVAVHRPSRVGGHSVTGVGNPDDAFWSLVRAMLVLGAAPDTGGHVDLVPADRVAAAIVHLLPGHGLTYHLTTPKPLAVSTVLNRLRDRGHTIAEVSATEWARRLDAAAEHDDSLALAATHVHTRPADAAVAFGRHNVEAAGIEFPPIEGAVLDAYLDHFGHTGFFPPPGGRP